VEGGKQRNILRGNQKRLMVAEGLDLLGFLYANDAAGILMIFVETRVFTEDLPKYLSDEEYRAFQVYLARDPEAGDRIPGTGGLRKVRWSVATRGKRGGVRIIYYYLMPMDQLRLILIYQKGIKDDLLEEEKRQLKALNRGWS